jgi:hypothetical protein
MNADEPDRKGKPHSGDDHPIEPTAGSSGTPDAEEKQNKAILPLISADLPALNIPIFYESQEDSRRQANLR